MYQSIFGIAMSLASMITPKTPHDDTVYYIREFYPTAQTYQEIRRKDSTIIYDYVEKKYERFDIDQRHMIRREIKERKGL